MLNPSIVEAIRTAWQADQAHPHRGRRQRALPADDHIQALVDTVFLSSLQEEEGKLIPHSVALVRAEEANEQIQHYSQAPLVLEQAILFTSSTLPKFAAAFDPALCTIAVQSDPKSNALVIWGVFPHSPTDNMFTGVPVCVAGNAHARPDHLTLTTAGRGLFAVSRGNSLIGRFQAGHFVPASPTPFTHTSLGAHLLTAIQRDPLYEAHKARYWHYVRSFFELLLDETAKRGHGGTIVLLEHNDSPIARPYIPKHKLLGSLHLRETLNECVKSDHDSLLNIAHRKVANEIIQRIAQLGAIDGALVLDTHFNVLALGATLTASRSSRRAVIGPDGFGVANGENFDISRFGTRHRSGFDFAASNPDATVFVISQDGPIRGFRSDGEENVLVWPDCTTTMFV